jgi:uncharacterized protein YqjF (DUF2071 family)
MPAPESGSPAVEQPSHPLPIGTAINPASAVAGYQRWRHLLFLHWSVPIQRLQPFVPPPLEVDTWNGHAYVGVVPLEMHDIRPRCWPPGCGLHFLEANLRTYVRLGELRGVLFLSLEANSWLAVRMARWRWGLPYFPARMWTQHQGERIVFDSQRCRSTARLHVVYEPGRWLGPSHPGTPEFFFLERYLMFVPRRGRLYVAQVVHEPYPARAAVIDEVQETLAAAAGLPPSCGPPQWAHYSGGVDVRVYALRRLEHLPATASVPGHLPHQAG